MVVLICISLIISDIEHLFNIPVSHLYVFLTPYQAFLPLFSMVEIFPTNIFYHSMGCLFTLAFHSRFIFLTLVSALVVFVCLF